MREMQPLLKKLGAPGHDRFLFGGVGQRDD